jgi:integrase
LHEVRVRVLRSGALKQAELWGLVPRNVARLVTPPRYSPQERRPFTRDEQLRILAAARDDPLYVLFRLAHASGLRQSALLGLQWPDLELDKGWLRVSKQLGRDGSLHRLKTKAARRAVPLPRVMVELLIRHRTEQEKMRADAVYWEDHDLVFTTRTGAADQPPQRAPLVDAHPRTRRRGAPGHPSPETHLDHNPG